jgi:hypothetical protein
MKKWVYLFNEVKEVEKLAGGSWDGVKSIVGGKGAGLLDRGVQRLSGRHEVPCRHVGSRIEGAQGY